MNIKTVTVGPLAGNCYVVSCERTGKVAVIDPGAEPDRILNVINKNRLKPELIINTHAHIDHVGANSIIMERTGARLLIHEEDVHLLSHQDEELILFLGKVTPSPPPNRLLRDEDEIKFGGVTLKVIHTPGHTPGGICLWSEKVVFTGDTLFAGGVGRTDFQGGSFEALMKSIRTKLLTLDEDTFIYPGHGPVSTIGHEKRHNPFLT